MPKKSPPKPYAPTYWNSRGKYQKEYEELYRVYVPRQGEAATNIGNILRLTADFYYDHLNNGSCNILMGWGGFEEKREALTSLLSDMPHRNYEIATNILIPQEEELFASEAQLRMWDAAIDTILEYAIALEKQNGL